MKHFISIFFCCFIISYAHAQKMKRVKVNNNIKIQLPTILQNDSETGNVKQVTTFKPLASYSTQNQSTSLIINAYPLLWVRGEEQIIHDLYKSNILSLFDQIEFIQDEVKNLGREKTIIFEFIGISNTENMLRKKKTKKYIYLQYLNYKNHVLLVNFNANLTEKKYWQPIAHQIMNNIKIQK